MSGDLSKLSALAANLRKLGSTALAQDVAAKSAGSITALGRATFAAGTDAYGADWAPGVDGRPVTLRRTGALERGVQYTAIGTKLRAVLGPKYARYQIGKRPIFPRAGAALPGSYRDVLAKALKDAAERTLRAG